MDLFLRCLHAMIDKRKLSAALTAELNPLGFTKKGATWYLRNEDTIAVLNLQKSNYDATFFLNVGFWLRKIEEVEHPKDELCHIRTRAEELWPTGNPSIGVLLGESTRCDDCAVRITAIRTFIREHIIPLLLEGSTIPGIVKLLEKHDGFLVRRVALDALGLQTE